MRARISEEKNTPMSGPLEGVNMVDFGQAGVGPWACTLLGMLGANVLKVERPEGDVSHGQPPLKNGLTVSYTDWNMAKKGSIFDLKDPGGRKTMEPLVREADVVCENLRPGVMDRLGFGYEGCRSLNPAIVYGASPAWGLDGPMASWPGVDADVQCVSGFTSMTGDEGGKPEMARHLYHLDLNASCVLAGSIILGLLQRDRTGESQHVVSTHLGSSMAHLGTRIAEYTLAGETPGPLGSASAVTAPHQAFLCEDRRWLSVGVETDEQWRALCGAIDRPDLLERPGFKTNRDRVANRAELATELEKVFAGRYFRWWYVQLTKHGVPAGPLYDFQDLLANQHVIENEFIPEMDIPHQGKLHVGGIPWEFSETPATLYRAPAPGEHTEEVTARGFGAFDSPRSGEPGYALQGRQGDPPLAGVRVVDASQGLCGPFVSLLLADAGTEVIKVEPPGGDYARAFAPAAANGDGAAFVYLNRNKKSVVLDLETDAGRRAFTDLAMSADILIEDWGVGKAQGLGLDYRSLGRGNPGLVYCALTPFGEKGIFKDLKGSELVVQGMAEYCMSLGQIGSPPVRWGSELANVGAAIMAFVGVLACLYSRNRSGRGQRVAVNQWGTLLCMRQGCWSVLGDLDEWAGPFCQAYTSPRLHGWQTRDRPVYLRLHRATEGEYVSLMVDLGMEDMLSDPRFDRGGRDATGNGKYAMEVMPIWESHLADKTAEEVIRLARSHNAVAVPMNTVKEVVDHPQVEALGIMVEMDQPGLGKVRVVGPPFEGPWQAPPVAASPALGQHTAEVLASLAGVGRSVKAGG